MHCDMLKIQDGVAIVEKLNCESTSSKNFFPYNFRASILKAAFTENLLERHVIVYSGSCTARFR